MNVSDLHSMNRANQKQFLDSDLRVDVLSPLFLATAKAEFAIAVPTRIERAILTAELNRPTSIPQHDAELLVMESELRRLQISNSKLQSELFPDEDPATISRWFSQRRMASTTFVALRSYLSTKTADLTVTGSLEQFCRRRLAIEWIGNVFLSSVPIPIDDRKPRVKATKWLRANELLWLESVHSQDVADVRQAVEAVPAPQTFKTYKASPESVLQKWGRPFRLYCMAEKTNE